MFAEITGRRIGVFVMEVTWRAILGSGSICRPDAGPDAQRDQASLQNPPVMANLFVPGCSTSAQGYPCPWSRFKEVTTTAIEPDFID